MLESLQLFALGGRQARTLPGITLRLADPSAERFDPAAQFLGDRSNRGPLRRMLGGVVEDHPDCALTQLRGVLAGSSHGLHPLSEWALRQTRYDSGSVQREGSHPRVCQGLRCAPQCQQPERPGDYHTTYSYQVSVGFQRQIGNDMSLQADYANTRSRNEAFFSRNANLTYNPATGANYPYTDTSRLPFPDWGWSACSTATAGRTTMAFRLRSPSVSVITGRRRLTTR